jgi:arsenite-transporting ATPase
VPDARLEERYVARTFEWFQFDHPVRVYVREDVAADVDAAWVVSPDLEHCEFCQRRWQVQQSALSEAMELFRGHDVKRVPLLADEVRGEAALRVVAACLR